MERNRKKIIIATTWIFISGYAFANKGIEKGYQDWRFYASLFGFLIPLIFVFLIYKSIKTKTNSR